MNPLGPLLLLVSLAPTGAAPATPGVGARLQDPAPESAPPKSAKKGKKHKAQAGPGGNAGTTPQRKAFHKPEAGASPEESDEASSRIRMRPRRDPEKPPLTPEQIEARRSTHPAKQLGSPRGVLRPPRPDPSAAAPVAAPTAGGAPEAAGTSPERDAEAAEAPEEAAATEPAAPRARARARPGAGRLTTRDLDGELRTHWTRLARLDELSRLFLARGDMERYRRVDELRNVENQRYRDVLGDYRQALGRDLERLLAELRERGGRWSRPDSVAGEELLRGED